MTQAIELGFLRDGSPLRVDLTKLVATRMLIQANSGGGKSGTLRLLAERAADKVQTIILDKEGEFATLREKVDMLVIGESGELPASIVTADVVAHRLLETQVSAVIDLSDMPATEQQQFVGKFLDAALNAPRELWHPALFMLDEAHEFCPQDGKADNAAAAAVIALMSLGRKRGFCGVLATQRLSKLHKDAAAECNNILIGRTTLDNDQKRAGEALSLQKDERLKLRDLQTRVFLGFGPAFSIDGIFRFKTGECETSMPQSGKIVTVPPPSSRLQHLFADGFASVPREAAERGDELDRLRHRVRQLEAELASVPPAEDGPDAAEVLREERNELLEMLRATVAEFDERVESAIRACDDALHEMTKAGVNGGVREAIDRVHAALWRAVIQQEETDAEEVAL